MNFLNWLLAVARTVGLKLLAAIVTCVIGYLIIQLILNYFPDGKRFEKMDPTVKAFLRSFVTIGLWVILIVCVIGILGVPMASVIAALASCGVAIGLAMQGSLSNLAGGIMLLLFRPFGVGDFIETSGNCGTVREIGVFYTLIITNDNKHVTIPNGAMMNNTVVNYSREENRRVDIDFGISYESDYEKACEIASRVASAHEKVLVDKGVFARITELADNNRTLTVRVWTEAGNYWDVRFDLIHDIKKAFDEEGISCAFSRVEVNVLNNK
ncbi:MAG: mechanosensitive ion channel family protein [Eubacteriales bacterium]